jgi:hypothetical protein
MHGPLVEQQQLGTYRNVGPPGQLIALRCDLGGGPLSCCNGLNPKIASAAPDCGCCGCTCSQRQDGQQRGNKGCSWWLHLG